ncbi:DUF1906 domain-containing protein [Streptomyces albus subsp. chlorinus]|uniref:DUF1906 domain-containing protein n=1 Tax=Streptomyces albus TaxID=1888 RepID=UPI00156F906E|nr:DUF1906 domain-containing protein [Streptomyces albus]NSC22586.1 DUF1906 domain-containing protein [Streptomyces albus subsp. chlorinus]
MATKNLMMRRMALLSAALAAVLTGGALPAAGAEPAPPDPATGRPTTPPPSASSSSSPGSPPSARPSAPQSSPPQTTPQSSPSQTAPQPSGPQPSAPSSGADTDTGAPSGTVTDPRTLTDPAAPDAPADPSAPGAPGVPAGPGDQPSLVRGDPRTFGAQIFQGNAFDTCQAPSVATMRAWKGPSPFGAVGIYIGGRGRACPKQKHLSPDWVTTVHKQGWKLLPLYVGSQSPCVIAKNKRKVRMSGKNPYAQGQREGADAVRQAQRFHMAKHSAIYLDMEAYRYKHTACAATTLRFVQGWNSAVRAQGYIAGFYSSANSGIAHLEKARAAGARGLPTAVWFARWRVKPSTDNERNLHPQAWQPHRRIHQHTGNKKRTYGGHTVTVDHNLVDAPVAVVV